MWTYTPSYKNISRIWWAAGSRKVFIMSHLVCIRTEVYFVYNTLSRRTPVCSGVREYFWNLWPRHPDIFSLCIFIYMHLSARVMRVCQRLFGSRLFAYLGTKRAWIINARPPISTDWTYQIWTWSEYFWIALIL